MPLDLTKCHKTHILSSLKAMKRRVVKLLRTESSVAEKEPLMTLWTKAWSCVPDFLMVCRVFPL